MRRSRLGADVRAGLGLLDAAREAQLTAVLALDGPAGHGPYLLGGAYDRGTGGR